MQNKLLKDLSILQKKIHAPKNKKNTFGKFNFRSVEETLERIKPLLGDNVLLFKENFIEVGERIFIKNEAILKNATEEISSVGFCELPKDSEGLRMDLMQLTGAASSYSKKRALESLFLLDNNIDIDSLEPSAPQKPSKNQTVPTLKAIVWNNCKKAFPTNTENKVLALTKKVFKKTLKQLTKRELEELNEILLTDLEEKK